MLPRSRLSPDKSTGLIAAPHWVGCLGGWIGQASVRILLLAVWLGSPLRLLHARDPGGRYLHDRAHSPLDRELGNDVLVDRL
jgi:hypothetical protein